MTAPTRALAEFAAHLRFEDLPAPVVHQACRLVLDAVGCAFSAWEEDPAKARIAAEMARMYPTPPLDRDRPQGANVIGSAAFGQPAFVALGNGILINAADNDDTHKVALLHVGSVVVPVALALAQARGLSGRDLITALVAGYEVAVRVGMAVMPTHYRFWHSTATNGTFGAAAAAARAMGLDADATQRALGIAGTSAGGLNTFFESGDMTKSIHPGKAAMLGILAAQMAQLGATSPPEILAHPKGYLAAYSLEPKEAALTAGLGSTWEILNNGFKAFPSILASHSPIQATLAMVNRAVIDPARIAAITVETYRTVTTHFSNKDVTGAMAARISVPYCVAAAAIDKVLGQAQFAPARVADPAVQALLAKTEVVMAPDLDPLYPTKFPARVTIAMQDGTRHQETVLLPKGDPGNPMSDDELAAKFRQNVAAFEGRVEAGRLQDAIMGLARAETLDALSVLLT